MHLNETSVPTVSYGQTLQHTVEIEPLQSNWQKPINALKHIKAMGKKYIHCPPVLEI